MYSTQGSSVHPTQGYQLTSSSVASRPLLGRGLAATLLKVLSDHCTLGPSSSPTQRQMGLPPLAASRGLWTYLAVSRLRRLLWALHGWAQEILIQIQTVHWYLIFPLPFLLLLHRGVLAAKTD